MLSNPAVRILIVEDEPELLDALVTYLNMAGLVADGVSSLRAAEQWLQTHEHDLLVLDLGLPDGDGLAWLQQHPALRDKGVIITTARGDSVNRLSGVRAGADVYLVKPVQLEELLLCIDNLMRRIRAGTSRNWVLNTTNWSLESPQGHTIKLTHSEAALLSRLAQTPGAPVGRSELVEQLGHNPAHYDLRRMETLVRRLRLKAAESLGEPLPVETVHKQGYAFTAPITVQVIR